MLFYHAAMIQNSLGNRAAAQDWLERALAVNPYWHPTQPAEARAAIARNQEGLDQPIVTTIEPKADWYPAEDYHQDYWAGEGQRNPYCLAVIPPKLQKLRKSFQARVKEAAG